MSVLRDHGAGRPATRAAERFAALLAEFGARGEGIVLAEQRPALLVPDVARSTAGPDRAPVWPPPGAGRPGTEPLGAPEVAVMAAEQTGPPRWGRMTRPPALDAGGLRGWPPMSRLRSAAAVPWPAGGSAAKPARATWRNFASPNCSPRSSDHAWLRVWTETFLLAFPHRQSLPAVPVPLQRRWQSLGTRSRECLLAQVIDRRVGVRAVALRVSYDPSRLAQVVASAAATRLDGAGSVGTGTGRGGRWPGAGLPACRAARASLGGPATSLAARDRAGSARSAGPLPRPPITLRRWTLIWPACRTGPASGSASGCGPCGGTLLSMELAANRQLAWTRWPAKTAGPLAADLGQVMPGVDHAQGLRHRRR